MNKIRLAVAMVALASAALCGCSDNYVDVEITDTIVEKHQDTNLNTAVYIIFDIPVLKHDYYFTLKQHGLKKVTKDVYDSHVVGDTYTWVESVLKESVTSTTESSTSSNWSEDSGNVFAGGI